MNEAKINRMKIFDRYLGIPGLHVLKFLQALLIPAPPAPEKIDKILMVKLWGIGNLVMIIPLIRAARRQYPDASIHFLTLESNRKLLEPLASLDGIITLRPEGMMRTAVRLWQIAAEIRRHRFDLILDFEQFLKITPILACLSGAPQSIGFKTDGQARAAAFNVKVPYRPKRHMSLAFGDIVRSAGIRTDGLPPLEVPRTVKGRDSAEAFVRTLPEGAGPLVALHIGSGDNFPGRRWPSNKFALLARKLKEEMDACCVLTGTSPEMDLGERCRHEAGVPMINAMGRFDILSFIEFLDRVDLLVTNDTAPAHIGSALGKPLIALYGPNTPQVYGPLHMDSRVFYNPLPCSPCLTNLNAKTSRCRIPSCILDIDTNDVFDACKELLESCRSVAEGGER
ncbi:MAG: glycosyltransferase family 9 protein [Planctomycetota bacterium]